METTTRILNEKSQESSSHFKKHFYKYLAVNAFLWCIWYVGIDQFSSLSEFKLKSVWPIYPTLGWGFGLAMKYINSKNK